MCKRCDTKPMPEQSAARMKKADWNEGSTGQGHTPSLLERIRSLLPEKSFKAHQERIEAIESEVARLLLALRNAGFELAGVFDGAVTIPCKTDQAAIPLILSVDAADVILKKGKRRFVVALILTNAPHEIIHDYTYTEELNAVIEQFWSEGE